MFDFFQIWKKYTRSSNLLRKVGKPLTRPKKCDDANKVKASGQDLVEDLDSTPLKGVDALLATVQMPSGIPVATMAVGRAGAKNAGILAAQILSLHRPELRDKLLDYKKELVRQVEAMERELANPTGTPNRL